MEASSGEFQYCCQSFQYFAAECFGFLDDDIEYKLLINQILSNFKNYLYKARKNRDLIFNILKNYFSEIIDLEVNLKTNDKYINQ